MQSDGTAQLWQDRLREQAGSGLGVKAWCEREGLAAATFYYWRKRLAAAAPVRFIALPAPLERGPGSGSALEVHTPAGYVIRVSAQAQVAWLGGVLAALR